MSVSPYLTIMSHLFTNRFYASQQKFKGIDLPRTEEKENDTSTREHSEDLER